MPTIDLSYPERVARYRSVPCPMPRCRAQAGAPCTTPNGWAAHHKAREALACGEQPKAAKPRRHRLTDAQATRLEWCVEAGGRQTFAGQYASFGGDAAERAVADALVKHGYVTQVGTTRFGERIVELTEAGWLAYHNDPKVIRRVPDEQHPSVCPCRASERARQALGEKE